MKKSKILALTPPATPIAFMEALFWICHLYEAPTVQFVGAHQIPMPSKEKINWKLRENGTEPNQNERQHSSGCAKKKLGTRTHRNKGNYFSFNLTFLNWRSFWPEKNIFSVHFNSTYLTKNGWTANVPFITDSINCENFIRLKLNANQNRSVYLVLISALKSNASHYE